MLTVVNYRSCSRTILIFSVKTSGNLTLEPESPAGRGSDFWMLFLQESNPEECKGRRNYNNRFVAAVRPFVKLLWTIARPRQQATRVVKLDMWFLRFSRGQTNLYRHVNRIHWRPISKHVARLRCVGRFDVRQIKLEGGTVLDSGAEGPGFKSQPRRCRVTVLGKLFTPIVPLFTKKLSYRRVTARCVLSVVILPITTQQCRNYLYDKSWPNRCNEVRGLVGGNVS